MIGRKLGGFVTSLIGAVTGGLQNLVSNGDIVSGPRKPIDPRDDVVSAFCGRKGGQARWVRAVHLSAQNGKAPSETLEYIRRSVAYDKRRAHRLPRTRTATGLLAY